MTTENKCVWILELTHEDENCPTHAFVCITPEEATGGG